MANEIVQRRAHSEETDQGRCYNLKVACKADNKQVPEKCRKYNLGMTGYFNFEDDTTVKCMHEKPTVNAPQSAAFMSHCKDSEAIQRYGK